MAKVTDTVAQLALPFVEAAGCSLWDVEYVKEAGEWFLRIYIDKEVRLYRARDGRKEFVGLLQSWQDGDVVLEVGGQPMSFEKKEVAQVRLYPRF